MDYFRRFHELAVVNSKGRLKLSGVLTFGKRKGFRLDNICMDYDADKTPELGNPYFFGSQQHLLNLKQDVRIPSENELAEYQDPNPKGSPPTPRWRPPFEKRKYRIPLEEININHEQQRLLDLLEIDARNNLEAITEQLERVKYGGGKGDIIRFNGKMSFLPLQVRYEIMTGDQEFDYAKWSPRDKVEWTTPEPTCKPTRPGKIKRKGKNGGIGLRQKI